jgi:hypothetical protein
VFEHNTVPTEVADLISRFPAGAVSRASATAAVGSVLPVPAVLRPILQGGGLRRGGTVEISLAGPLRPGRSGPSRGPEEEERYLEAVAPGGCSLLLLLMAEVSGAGSWCALVNGSGVGLAAAAEAGVVLERLALVPEPGRDWVRVVGALLDGFDLVAVRPPTTLCPADARLLAARVRRHGSVLVSLGPWAGADVRIRPMTAHWEGLGVGHGRLSAHRLLVGVSGRGVRGCRSETVELSLSSGPGGTSEPPVASRSAPVEEVGCWYLTLGQKSGIDP